MKRHQVISAIFISSILLSTIGCAATPKKESTGQYVDDSVITTKVKPCPKKVGGYKKIRPQLKTINILIKYSEFSISNPSVHMFYSYRNQI